MLLVLAGLGVIAMSWALVHSLFGLRYARLHYGHARWRNRFVTTKPCLAAGILPTWRLRLVMTFRYRIPLLTADIRAAVLPAALLSYIWHSNNCHDH